MKAIHALLHNPAKSSQWMNIGIPARWNNFMSGVARHPGRHSGKPGRPVENRLGFALIASLALAGFAMVAPAQAAKAKFFLKNSDRVCFYGDSITEQRFYAADVQTYVLTRFPKLHVKFVDAGVGGDRVTGGWAGPINVRLKRDVFPFKPNVVTIMLGMNDAGYRPFNQAIFNTYRKGYEHIIASLKRHLPGVRIVLLGPSPYDDVTQKVGFPGGYNAVLIRYDQFVKRLAQRNHLLYVDFNAPMVKVLKEADKINPTLAKQIFPGRVHPSAAAEMMMAQALLKAWGAPATVTNVSISATAGSVTHAVNTHLSNLKAANGGLTWTQSDNCLPMPVIALHENWPQFPSWSIFLPPQPKPGYTNPAAALIDRLSGFTHQLDREMLTVKGLSAAHYKLLIDGKAVGEFTPQQLGKGINLARYFTPMLWQAYDVDNIVWEEIQAHFVAWHSVQTELENWGWQKPNLPVTTENDPALARTVAGVMKAMNKLGNAIVAREYTANQPKAHHYALVPVGG
jgi:lysophospholipase L1-like esterase